MNHDKMIQQVKKEFEELYNWEGSCGFAGEEGACGVLNCHQLKKEKHPEKWQARQDLRNAVASGKVRKKPCEVCGELIVEAHHEDYKKPLEVNWLCARHHGEKHRKN